MTIASSRAPTIEMAVSVRMAIIFVLIIYSLIGQTCDVPFFGVLYSWNVIVHKGKGNCNI